MELKELRIGNIIRHNVKEDETGGFCEPNEASITEDDMFHFYGGVGLGDAEPIPLTEDWLKRFGFEEPDGRDGYGGLLSPVFNGSRIRVKDNSWMCYESTVRLDYVHQLQNLYFALTGTELDSIPEPINK